jgi:tRNA(Ile)-lysidine synthase
VNITIDPGKYIVAVSGGVDSVVLLDVLSKLPGLTLTVAHYDHGIRKDSNKDRAFVQKLVAKYNLPFVFDEGNLGPSASEAVAREKRYKFLHRVREAAGASAIITAHHQNDVLETAILNILRGTGRKGLSSLKSTDQIIRPVLDIPKDELVAYAKEHELAWREDPTNVDTKYLRNYIRHKIMPKLSADHKQQLLGHIKKAHELDEHIHARIINQLHQHEAHHILQRHWFIMLPHTVAREVMVLWLRNNDVTNIDRKMIERLVVDVKTLKNGGKSDVTKNFVLHIGPKQVALRPRNR